MQFEPSVELFAARYAAGESQVVSTTLVADLETPVSAFLKIAGSRPASFLLESVEDGAVRGRYSIIGLEPDVIFRINGRRAEINRVAQTEPEAFRALDDAPLVARPKRCRCPSVHQPKNIQRSRRKGNASLFPARR